MKRIRTFLALAALSVSHAAFSQSADACDSDVRGMGFRPSPKGRATARRVADTRAPGLRRDRAGDPLPARWDSREHGWITPIRNQGGLGTCWAFASYATLEAQFLKDGLGERDFSEKNMANLHGWNLAPEEGGDYNMAAGYLLRWSGAVDETNDVYITSVSQWTSSPPLPPAVRVQNVVWTDALDGSQEAIDATKRAIMEYGAVATALYWGTYYEKGASYYCPEDKTQNHAIAFVGWDDDYPTNNFRVAPPGKGAWIVKNSWGRSHGEQGYYFVSYHDVTLGRNQVGVVFVPAGLGEDYGAVRGHDRLGPVFDASASNSVVLSQHDLQASVFTASWNERLDAVGLWTTVYPNPCEISVYTNVTRGGATPVAGGTLATQQTNTLMRAGFSTIPLETPVPLADGTGFAIVYRQTGTNLSNVVNCDSADACHPDHRTGNSYFGYYKQDGGIEGATWFDGKTIVEEDAGHIDTNDVSWAATIKAYTRSTTTARAGDAPDAADDGTAYLADLAGTNAVLFAETGGAPGASAGLVGANGRTLWASWLAGFDPADPHGGELIVSILMTNDVPRIDWTPDLGDRRTYTLWGADSLGGADAWRPVDPADPGATGARFFKVSVGP